MNAPRPAYWLPEFDSAASQSRLDLASLGPLALHRTLCLLDELHAPPPAAEALWALAGLGAAISRLLAEDQTHAGRRVIESIFALHQIVNTAVVPAMTPHQQKNLQPYLPLMISMARQGEPWKSLLIRWIDTFSQRLTLHRYSDRKHRRRQARELLARPLQIVFKAGDDLPPSMERLAEHLLAGWDLLHARRDAHVGWNRIELPAADQIGGFYGLSDQARIPDEQTIRQSILAWLAADVYLPADDENPATELLNDWITRLQLPAIDLLKQEEQPLAATSDSKSYLPTTSGMKQKSAPGQKKRWFPIIMLLGRCFGRAWARREKADDE